MATTKVTCPRCSRPLKSNKALSPGTRVLCPVCGTAFATPTIRKEVLPPGATFSGRPSAGEPVEPGKRWLVLAGLAGAFLLLAGASAVAVFLAVRAGEARDDPALAVPGPEPEAVRPPYREEPPSTASRPPPSAEPPPQPWLPPRKQEKVDRAIERGVAYLKKLQAKDGSWFSQGYHGSAYRVGQTALPALTLLKCDVPPDDPHVRKAARYVRSRVKGLDRTYDIALALLFLDRLGDPADEAALRTLTVRLIAGQTATGGWSYQCPKNLTPRQELALLTVLEERTPRDPLRLFPARKNGRPPGWIASKPAEGSRDDRAGPPRSVFGRGPGTSTRAALAALPRRWQRLPAMRPPEQSHRMPPAHFRGSDNSNTQFATLALWAARRRGLPVDRALALVVQRFRTSQDRDGNWDYYYHRGGASSNRTSMTGAGLLGLAVGHGLVAPTSPAERRESAGDPAVEKGLKAFAIHIGKQDPRHLVPHEHSGGLYYLWTVERVGMLFSLRTIDGKDWYGWGSDLLVKHQAGDGSWHLGGYYQSTRLIDTAFALLFLRRADLATDLSKSVEFLTAGKQGHGP
jgi:hypothetical protein